MLTTILQASVKILGIIGIGFVCSMVLFFISLAFLGTVLFFKGGVDIVRDK